MSRVPAIRFKGFTDPWEQRKLGEIAEVVGGGTPNTGVESYWDGDIDWYSPAELGVQIYVDCSVRKITKAGYDSCSATMLPANITILFTSRAGIGNTAILRRSACTNQGFQSLVINDSADVYFVYSMTNKIKKFAEQQASGSTFLEISGKGLAAGEFTFPSKDEQIRIGTFFQKLDHLITLHQRKYDKLCTVKKSMLDKMFPKPGELVPEIRFEGFTDPWEQRKFSELIERRNDYSDDPILPRVEYEDIVPSQGTLNKDVINKRDKRSGIVFESGDVLYGKLRPYLQNWLNPQFRGIALGDFWVLNPIRIDSGFLFYLIRTSTFERIANESVGTKMPRADWQNVSNAEFVISSSKNEQRQIGTFFQKLDHLITLHQRKLELLKNIKKSLLDKMFV